MRPTHTYDIIKQIIKLPYVTQSIDTWTQVDGTATLVRGKDGNAYEIVVRPASESTHPKLKQKTLKKGVREMKSFNELNKELNESTVKIPMKMIEPPKDTSREAIKIFKAMYKDSGGVSAPLSSAAFKLSTQLKGLGYWVSNVRGEMRLNKIGYDSQGLKIVTPRGSNK